MTGFAGFIIKSLFRDTWDGSWPRYNISLCLFFYFFVDEHPYFVKKFVKICFFTRELVTLTAIINLFFLVTASYTKVFKELTLLVTASPAVFRRKVIQHFLTFAAAGAKTAEGKPVHAITSMSPTETIDNIILLAFPKEGASFVSQTYAGRVNGNSAMNSKGFSWTMTTIMSDNPAWGMPPEVYFYYLAQMTASSDEALAYLKSTPKGGVTGGFILTDASGNISAFEGIADKFHLSKPVDRGEAGQFVVETNHLIDPSLKSLNPKWLPAIGTYARYDTIFQLLQEAMPGSVDFAFGKNFFASDDR